MRLKSTTLTLARQIVVYTQKKPGEHLPRDEEEKFDYFL